MGSKRKRAPKEGVQAGSAPSKKAKQSSSASTKRPTTKPSFEKLPFAETPTSEDRKREAALYELLGSEDEEERIAAADCIVSGLLLGDGVPEAVLQRHLERRLFRGLASGRNASRLGFSLVITEILAQLFGQKELAETKYQGLNFRTVLGVLVEKTQSVGSVPGQEERDHYFGQLFGIECFVRAQILFEDSSRWHQVLDVLLKLASKKIWLRSQCGWVLVQAVPQMSKAEAESTLEKLAEQGIAKTPEGVALWLVIMDRFPSLSVKPWRNPLANKSLGDLAAVLKESTQDSGKDQRENGRQTKQASWTAQLHYVWTIILGHFQKSAAIDDDFDQFWSRVVDEGLFSRHATDGQKFKGFMVFQSFLEALAQQPGKTRLLFSKNFITCLMNQAAKEDRYLHRAATKALKAIETVVAAHPTALVPILDQLLGEKGAYNFDQRTSTKTVDKLLQNITEASEKPVLKIMQRSLKTLAELDAASTQSTLRTYVDYLSKALNGLLSAGSEDGIDKQKTFGGLVLNELTLLAYSNPKSISKEALTPQIRELCRSRLETSLAKLTRQVGDFGVFCNIVAQIDSTSIAMDDAIKVEKDKALSRMHKLLKQKSITAEAKSLYQGLAMLHAVSIFQLYNEDPDAMEVLSDLEQFAERLQGGKIAKDNEGSSEFLVEILLSMVARPSSLMRQVSQQVFDAFTSQISSEGLELLTGPLASGESTTGQKELFNTEDDDMIVDGDSEDEDGPEVEDIEDASDFEMGSDVEFLKLKSEDEESEEDENDEDEDSDDEEEKDAAAEANGKSEPIELDMSLGAILKSHRLDKDIEAESSDSDADMSDSEMLALDDKLAEVIKQHVNSRSDSKKVKKDAKQSVINFKNRILDLLDIYVKNETLNPLAFQLLVPLLNLVRTTSTKALSNRGCEIILNYQKHLKKARGNKEEAQVDEPERLVAMLVEVHDEAGKDNAHAYAKAASAASLILASALFAVEKSSIKQIAAVYAKTQSDWVLGEAQLQTSFFADWNNWCQNQASLAKK